MADIIRVLEKELEEYDRVVVAKKVTDGVRRALVKFVSERTDKRILLIYADGTKEEYTALSSRHVSQEEPDEYIKLYRMYSFSDKIYVLDDGKQFGTLQNFVDTGILTEEEAVEALLM